MSQLNLNKINSLREVSIVPIRGKLADSINVDHLVLKDQNGYDIIPFNEILHCQADGNYCVIFTNSGKRYATCKTLKEIERRLPRSKFIRIHQSHVVALVAIRRIDAMQYVCLINGAEIPYSRRLKGSLLSSLGIK